jgi:hypothetical protein
LHAVCSKNFLGRQFAPTLTPKQQLKGHFLMQEASGQPS